MLRQPTIVNFFGQPGAGKSTAAAELFAYLKRQGADTELVTEFAKDLTWEQRHFTLGCQPYIFGKQLRNIERLVGGVDIVITDSPILLSSFYGIHNNPDRYPASFHTFVLEQFQRMGGLNYFLERVKPYNPNGRSQSEAEAEEVGRAQLPFLWERDIPVRIMRGVPESTPIIAEEVLQAVEHQRAQEVRDVERV